MMRRVMGTVTSAQAPNEFARLDQECKFVTDAEAAEALACSRSKVTEWRNGTRPAPPYIIRLIECIARERGR